MAARPYVIPKPAHEALNRAATYRGARVVVTEQLGPDVWPHVKNTLEKLGAVYVVGASAFDFEPGQDARTLVTAALAAGTVTAVSATHGYVPTPADLAREIVDRFAHMWCPTGERLRALDPSAGNGRLVSALMRDGERDAERCADIAEWMHITAVEIDVRRARQIPSSAAVAVVRDDFLSWADRTRKAGGVYDRIVMNPPFSVTGDAQAWAKHVAAAWTLLAPGGRLVAITPALNPDHDHRNALVRAVLALVAEHGGHEPLDDDAFAESGVPRWPTSVLWLDRPPVGAPTVIPPVDMPAWQARPYTGAEQPVLVTRPFLTRGAALETPVQAYVDTTRRETRILRHQGDCFTCGRIVWAFDDGNNTPLGELGDSAPGNLDPESVDEAPAPEIVLCFGCANTRTESERALTHALTWWPTVRVTEPASVLAALPAALPAEPVHVSAWLQLTLIDA